MRMTMTGAQAVADVRPVERHDPVAAATSRWVPTLLAFVAGYVDSCTFIAFNGLFVAQLTGSFVVAGSEAAIRNDGFLIKVLAIPVFFAAGIVATIIVRAFAAGDRRAWMSTLALEAILLAGLMGAGVSAAPAHTDTVAVLFGLAAMGVQSALAHLLLRGYGSTNVMTTNTTQLSIDVADILFAARRLPGAACDGGDAARVRLSRFAPVVFGFLMGTVAGGLAYTSAGFICLMPAIGIVAALTIWAARCPPQAQ